MKPIMRSYKDENDYWRVRQFLIVPAIGNKIATCATFWYEGVTRTVYVEPVVTVPEHHCHGLARAAITEGLRRPQRLGAVRAFVSGYEPGPDALYS
jgi:hypothetical protein